MSSAWKTDAQRPVSLLQRGERDEESLRIERNRAAFEAWLEKKRLERKTEHVSTERREEEEWERRRGIGQRAFEGWLKMKRAEDEEHRKEFSRERELKRLKREEVRGRQQTSLAAFDSWKHLKDVELEAERDLERRYKFMHPARREPTPSLPGYCSVWSCDLDMARHFVGRVRRSSSLDLSHYHTSYNITHPHTLTPSQPHHTS